MAGSISGFVKKIKSSSLCFNKKPIIAVCGRLINMKVSGHHVIHHQINLGAKSDSSPYHRTFLMAIYDTFMEKHIY